MNLYFKGKLSQRSYPIDEPLSGELEKDFSERYGEIRGREEEVKKLFAEYRALSEVYSGVDSSAVPRARKEEFDRWQELFDIFNSRFVEDPKTLGRLSRGESMEVTELTIPDDHPILDYLESVTEKTRSIAYRIPSQVLWDHLGKKRDWSIRFTTLFHSFEGAESEIVRPRRSELQAKGNDKILLYHAGPIKIITPQESEALERRYTVLKKYRDNKGGDEALERKDKSAFYDWNEVKGIGQGALVYTSLEDARKAAGEKGDVVVFTIPEEDDCMIDAIREKQDADASFYLPWKLLWDHVFQERDKALRWEHKLIKAVLPESDEPSLGSEGKSSKGKL